MPIKPSSPKNISILVKTEQQEAWLNEKEVIFSFRYLDLTNKKFNYNNRNIDYFHNFIERLRDVSKIRIRDIGAQGKTLRCHPINWDETTETCFNIPNEEEIVAGGEFQFALSSNEHGRIHGFFIGNIFCVVWMDPDHKLYKKKKRSSM